MNAVLKVIILVVIVTISQFVLMVEYNEMDVIPYGYSLFNSDWLQNDWYLQLEILYRIPFGYVSGFFVHLFDFIPTIFFGRLVSYFFFSFAYLKLLEATKINFSLGCAGLMVFLTFFPTGMSAGEWMIGGLETKVFAYSFAFLAISAVLQKQLLSAFLYSGFALSLHLLVGGYHLICLTSILVYQMFNNGLSIREILKKSYPFLIGGSWGLIGVLSYLFIPVDQEISRLGWEVYVHIRVPYHVLPKLYVEALIFPFLFSVLNLGMLFIVKEEKLKHLTLYVLTSVLISLLGVLIYLVGDQSFLRFYFFRFNDTIQPFLTILILSSLLTNYSGLLSERINIKWVRSQAIIYFAVVVAGILFIVKKESNIKELLNLGSYQKDVIESKISFDLEMAKWIRQNTPEEAVFIIPTDWETFYMEANRAVFVSWKHAPQKAEDLVEWYRRIQMINRDENLFDPNIEHRRVIASNYQNLTTRDVLEIKSKYPTVTHLIFPSKKALNLREIYLTDDYALYKLEPDFLKN